MKTPEEWMGYLKDHPDSKQPTVELLSWAVLEQLIVAIQRDALSSPLANTTDQEELEMMKAACDKFEIDVAYWKESWALMREKWREARRYLRAANKGAERNNQVMRLQSYDIERLLERIKQLEQTNQ
jgi:hypothetical protein